MSEHNQLVAYIATLLALVVIVIGALIVGAMSGAVLGKMEAFGIGTVTGGLIGVLRIPSARAPVQNVEQAETVVAPDSKA